MVHVRAFIITYDPYLITDGTCMNAYSPYMITNGLFSIARYTCLIIFIPFRIKEHSPDGQIHHNCPNTLKLHQSRPKYLETNPKLDCRLKKITLCRNTRVGRHLNHLRTHQMTKKAKSTIMFRNTPGACGPPNLSASLALPQPPPRGQSFFRSLGRSARTTSTAREHVSILARNMTAQRRPNG